MAFFDVSTCTIYCHKNYIDRVFEEEYNRLLDHKDFRPKGYDYSNQVWMALWDDHDYGENDAAKEYGEKLPSKKAFIDFIEKIQETNHISEIDEQLAAIKEDDARGVYYYHDYEQKLDSGKNLHIAHILSLNLNI